MQPDMGMPADDMTGTNRGQPMQAAPDAPPAVDKAMEDMEKMADKQSQEEGDENIGGNSGQRITDQKAEPASAEEQPQDDADDMTGTNGGRSEPVPADKKIA